MLLLALLFADPALAHSDRPEVQVQAGVFRGERGPQLSGGVRAYGDRDAYVGVEGRVDPEQEWLGRVGAGFDILGGCKWDLRLGLFLGGTGTGFRQESRFIVGTEIAAAAEIGRLYGQWRWMLGLGPSDTATILSEHELTVGFRLIDQVRVQGQALFKSPSSFGSRTALGLGVTVIL